ncbi:MAG TPA: lysophospholipid acyltransferase family protein [Rhodospirillales bacterium]|nr:lysophospholipid acyltransferase family protein [Rhodospirillales bacterium]HJO68787.1 lysophospholipid acyltransferase family protein [Rhodospirillales bacterium]
MRPFKRILESDAVRAGLCWLGALYIRFVHATSRWSAVGGEVPRALWHERRAFILCFWHGRLLMIPYCWNARRPIRTLTSDHRDGRLIARTTAHLGIPTLVGSSSRGGASALRAMVRSLAQGESIGITPDGPRGPRMRATAGIVKLARLSGAPIVPVGYSTGRRRVLDTWDRFFVALPFSRGAFVWGDAIEVEPGADSHAIERARQAVETSLNAVTAEADRICGVEPVAPAPPRSERSG